jgi:hypothetical protein
MLLVGEAGQALALDDTRSAWEETRAVEPDPG